MRRNNFKKRQILENLLKMHLLDIHCDVNIPQCLLHIMWK